MTALVVSFPQDRIYRTRQAQLQIREDREDALVARLVDALENDPKFAHIKAMLEARCARLESERSP
ncbi:hypothetical protein [Lysobacter sp. GCM10012299]|uniref:hypothetical protein n=1 Tax=Lysobacter sp. GCM10012299 TaxID=3317333 RepID=UPI0036215B30